MIIELKALTEKNKILFASWDLPTHINKLLLAQLKDLIENLDIQEQVSISRSKMNGVELYEIEASNKNFYEIEEDFNNHLKDVDLVY